MDLWFGLDALPRLTDEQAASYEQERAAARNRALARTTVAVGAFYLLYGLVDILLLGDIAWLSLSLRYGLILPLMLALGWYQSGQHPIHHKEIATLALAITGNIVWCVIVTASKNPAALHYYYAAAVFQMVVTIAVRPIYGLSLFASLVTAVINYGFIGFVEGMTAVNVAYHLAVYGPTVVLTLVASHQLEVERQRAFLQMHENEALKRELSRQNDDLARLSSTDPLTQLPNRRGTEAEIARLRRTLKPHELQSSAVLIVDIDHFKAFNDSYGHGAGDGCLREVARAMRRDLPDTVHLARLGGEEFLAVMPLTDQTRAGMFAERVRRAVRSLSIEHAHTGDRNRHVTVSIGVACGSIANDTLLNELLEAADEALYGVKGDGRNGWRLAPSPGGSRSIDAA
ncbi:GGDEF domain-containing protein [Rhizobium sp. CAU 1783]